MSPSPKTFLLHHVHYTIKILQTHPKQYNCIVFNVTTLTKTWCGAFLMLLDVCILDEDDGTLVILLADVCASTKLKQFASIITFRFIITLWTFIIHVLYVKKGEVPK